VIETSTPTVIQLPHIFDSLGSLGIIQGAELLPFQVNRVYFIHSVSEGAVRGSHAHKKLQQLIFAASGSFDLILNDGEKSLEFQLHDPTIAVQVPRGYWRTLHNFSADAVCMVLASTAYDESDYIRDYDEFLRWRKS